MIAKCVALLAVVAQINCYAVNSNCCGSAVASGCGTVIGTAGCGGCGCGSVGCGCGCGTGAPTRNIVAKGRYPVALCNNGPIPDCRIPVSTTHIRSPVQEKPTIRLPAKIPCTRTVAHSCTCFKQILRPRVHDQYITIPTIQRYIETTHKPIVENIHYEAVPVNTGCSCGCPNICPAGPACGSVAPVVAATPVCGSAPVCAPVCAGYGVVSNGCGCGCGGIY